MMAIFPTRRFSCTRPHLGWSQYVKSTSRNKDLIHKTENEFMRKTFYGWNPDRRASRCFDSHVDISRCRDRKLNMQQCLTDDSHSLLYCVLNRQPDGPSEGRILRSFGTWVVLQPAGVQLPSLDRKCPKARNAGSKAIESAVVVEKNGVSIWLVL